jgi:hypothetical protein
VSEPAKLRRELFIWWTTDQEAAEDPGLARNLPEYVQEQYVSRRVARGRAQLFAAEKFGRREIAEWPPTMIASMLREGTSAGIVFVSSDLAFFKGVPGLVTDFKLRVVVI